MDNSNHILLIKGYEFRALKCIFVDSPGWSINYLFATSLEQTLSELRLLINKVEHYEAAQNCYPDHKQRFSSR